MNKIIFPADIKNNSGRDSNLLNVMVTLILWLLGIIYLYPFYLCLMSSFKTRNDLAESVISLPKKIILDNYVKAFINAGFFHHFINSLFVTFLSLVLIVVFGSMAAYSIARWRSKWSKLAGLYILGGIIVPFQLALIPLYKIMRELHFSGTLWGFAILLTAQGLPFSIFLWSGFVKTIPVQMEESAKIDGCHLFRMYWQVVFPLMKTISVTVIILVGSGNWNDFLYSMLFLPNPKIQTLPLSIYSFVGQYGNDWPPIFADIILIEAPILIMYLFAQKHIIKGMTSGAVKG